jgi:hypothetical protein
MSMADGWIFGPGRMEAEKSNAEARRARRCAETAKDGTASCALTDYGWAFGAQQAAPLHELAAFTVGS